MTQVEKLAAHSRVGEVDTSTSQIVSALKKDTPENDAFLMDFTAQLSDKGQQISAAANSIKAESDLAEVDVVRDELISDLNYLLKGYMHHPDAAIKEAAVKTYKVYDNYGVAINKLSYTEQSSKIKSLVTDLQKVTPEVAQLSGVETLMGGLQQAQSDFEVAEEAYRTEKNKDNTTQAASTIRKEIMDLINDKLVPYLNTMNMVNPTVYEALSADIASIIVRNNDTVKRRRKK